LPRTCSLSALSRVLAALTNHSRVDAAAGDGGGGGVGGGREELGFVGADGSLPPEAEMIEDPCARNTFVGTTAAATAGGIANFDLAIGASGRHAILFSSPGLKSWVSVPNASGGGGLLFIEKVSSRGIGAMASRLRVVFDRDNQHLVHGGIGSHRIIGYRVFCHSVRIPRGERERVRERAGGREGGREGVRGGERARAREYRA